MLSACVFCAVNLSAKSMGTTSDDSSRDIRKGWNTIWLEYNPSTFHMRDASVSFRSSSFGYGRAIGLSSKIPLYIEPAIGMRYSYMDEHKGQEVDLDMWSVRVPVNVEYVCRVANGPISLIPYAGLDFRYNFSGELGDRDIFDDGASGEAARRFQVGWQAGVKVGFGKYVNAYVSYGTDFNEFDEDIRIHTISIGVGVTL